MTEPPAKRRQPASVVVAAEPAAPCETLLVLLERRAEFPHAQLPGVLPAMLLKHQLYPLVGDPTSVDRDLERLMAERAVRLAHLNLGADQHVVLLAEDYCQHVRQSCKVLGAPDLAQVEAFLDLVMATSSISLSKRQLCGEAHLSEDEITSLVKAGALHIRDTVSLWVGVPNMGAFVDHVRKGRQAVLACIGRAKYKEMLERVLEGRKLRGTKLGTKFHILDVLGLRLVDRIQTTSGSILRLAARDLV